MAASGVPAGAAGSVVTGQPSKSVAAFRSLELCDRLKLEIGNITSEIGYAPRAMMSACTCFIPGIFLERFSDSHPVSFWPLFGRPFLLVGLWLLASVQLRCLWYTYTNPHPPSPWPPIFFLLRDLRHSSAAARFVCCCVLFCGLLWVLFAFGAD